MKRLAGLFVFGMATLSATLAHAETILFDQLPGSVSGTWASQNDTNPGGLGQFATTYDNFMLTESAVVTHVDWEGQFFQGEGQPDTSGISAFTLTFYEDNAGEPGAAIASSTIQGNAGQTPLGMGGFGPAFSYSADLPVSFHADAATPYWLSIVPDLGFPPQWGWNKTSPPGIGISFQDFFGERVQRDDVAFRLEGATSVPEPATMLLVAAGCAGVLRRRLRRA